MRIKISHDQSPMEEQVDFSLMLFYQRYNKDVMHPFKLGRNEDLSWTIQSRLTGQYDEFSPSHQNALNEAWNIWVDFLAERDLLSETETIHNGINLLLNKGGNE